jgi:arylamine N-acetyltransferase
MPRLDYTLSFHVGLMARVASSRQAPAPEAGEHLLLIISRKVGEALDAVDEAETFRPVRLSLRGL